MAQAPIRCWCGIDVYICFFLFSSSLSCRYSKIAFLFTCSWINCHACFHTLVNNNQILRKANKFSNVANASSTTYLFVPHSAAGVHWKRLGTTLDTADEDIDHGAGLGMLWTTAPALCHLWQSGWPIIEENIQLV